MQVCIHIYIDTIVSRNIVQMAVVTSVLNARDFQRQFDWDAVFVHSRVDRGWQYWITLLLRKNPIISVSHLCCEVVLHFVCKINKKFGHQNARLRYSEVNMGKQSQEMISAPWCLTVKRCRFEQWVAGLTVMASNSCSRSSRCISRYLFNNPFMFFKTFLMSLCNSKPLHVRKLRFALYLPTAQQ